MIRCKSIYIHTHILYITQSESVYMTCPVDYIYTVVHEESESEDQIDQFLDTEEKIKENRNCKTIYNIICNTI